MIVPLLGLLFLRQAPQSFEELEIDKIAAFHGLKSFHEQVDLKVISNGKTYLAHRDTKEDGKQIHVVITSPDQEEFETIDDGMSHWAIEHGKHVYVEEPVSQNSFDPKQYLLKVDPDTGSVTMNSEMPVQIAYAPPPVIQSVAIVHEGKQTLRRVVAVATGSKGNKVTITQWFLPDRWILKKATLEGVGANGPLDATVTVTQLDFDALFGPTDFQIDRSVERSYQKVDQLP